MPIKLSIQITYPPLLSPQSGQAKREFQAVVKQAFQEAILLWHHDGARAEAPSARRRRHGAVRAGLGKEACHA
ncbi:MAG: hypothetical protein AMXMBFR7_25510 [Planctomycetota bacterium]